MVLLFTSGYLLFRYAYILAMGRHLMHPVWEVVVYFILVGVMVLMACTKIYPIWYGLLGPGMFLFELMASLTGARNLLFVSYLLSAIFFAGSIWALRRRNKDKEVSQ